MLFKIKTLTPTEDVTVEDSWAEIKIVFNEVSKEVIRFQEKRKQPWISQNT